MPTYPWLELPLLGLAVVGTLIILYARLFVRVKTTKQNGSIEEAPKGTGARMIQLIGLIVLVPTIAILGLEKQLSAEATAALLGTIVGYALSGIAAAVPKR